MLLAATPHATTVNWFDVFDPATGSWQVLPPAPHARDHFHAVVADDKLYALGGRITGSDDFANNTVAEVDVYDFVTGLWKTLPSPQGDVPTERAGTAAALLGDGSSSSVAKALARHGDRQRRSM